MTAWDFQLHGTDVGLSVRRVMEEVRCWCDFESSQNTENGLDQTAILLDVVSVSLIDLLKGIEHHSMFSHV